MISKPILRVEGLHKVFPNGFHALKGVSFSVYPGEFVAVIGLSGSGKSTLLRCLNRLIDPTAGQVWVEDQNVAELTQDKDIRRLRSQMAMIFQHFNLVGRYSALTNVLLGRLFYIPTWKSLLGLFPAEDRQKAKEYLEMVGLGDKIHTPVARLSGGQQQRVAIARALMQNPKILLADEPVAALDPATCHVVMDYLKKINRQLGMTVLANLHFLSLVREYADRVIALKEGSVVFDGLPHQIDDQWFEKIYGQGAREVHVH